MNHRPRPRFCRGERIPDSLFDHHYSFSAGRGSMDSVALLYHNKDQTKK